MSIQIRNVSKTFGTFRALQDINLDIPTGELVALLGPSGSGKTTLLRLIAGLEDLDPGDGSIRYFEEDVAGQPVRRRRVGFVFQHYALFRHMSVFGNVAFGLRVLPRNKRPSEERIQARVHELLSLVQLDGLAGRYPSQLSGGQRQRVALARALAVEPRVLLLDEPFGALDAKVRLELRVWLRKLHDELHITSVFVTHDQDEALEVADRVVVMNKGRIEQVGTPTDVYHEPRTDFVMNFLGKVNVFAGQAQQGWLELSTTRLPDRTQRIAGPVRIFIRPHELEVFRDLTESACFEGRVVRAHAAGSVARLDLQLSDGSLLTAELPPEKFHALCARQGDLLRAIPRRIHIF